MQDINAVMNTMVSSMTTLLVARFLLNDVPHAAGLMESDVEAVSRSRWARNIAKGQLKLAGIGPDDPDYETYVGNYARKAAEGFVGR
jgi:hypothetical protein